MGSRLPLLARLHLSNSTLATGEALDNVWAHASAVAISGFAKLHEASGDSKLDVLIRIQYAAAFNRSAGGGRGDRYLPFTNRSRGRARDPSRTRARQSVRRRARPRPPSQ